MKSMDEQLQSLLQKLEISSQKIVETRGYTREVEKLRILQETIKEQITNENTRTAARPVR